MRVSIVLLGLLIPVSGCAATAAPPPAKDPGDPSSGALPAKSSVDEVLDALDRRGKELREFVADVKLTETDDSTQLSVSRSGRVWYQSTGDARMRVVMDKKDDGKHVSDEKIEYLLDHGVLVDRDYKNRVEVKRQVVRPGEKINLLKLGEGPFPLPIGQKREDVYKQFDVQKIDPAPNDPAGTIHLQLKPKKGTQFARKFSTIDVWVDPQSKMPRRIDTFDANQTTTRSTELTNLKVNPQPGLGESDFTLPDIDSKSWDLHSETYSD